VIDPVAFELGPLQVHWYGIIIAAAALAGGALATRVAPWVGENPDHAWNMLLLVMVLAIIGARLYHVIHLWDYYSANPVEIPQVWNGGLGIPGGVVGGALGVWIYCRSQGLNAARWMDIAAPALLLGQVIGRLGNFVNQELYGPPTTLCGTEFPPCLPFGIPIDEDHRAGTPWTVDAFPVDETLFVPLFAYEMVLNLIGMFVILFAIRRFGPRLFAGDAALLYFIWYGSVRALLENYRVNNWTIIGVPTAIWIGILAVVLSAAWLIYRHRRGWGSPMIRPAEEREAGKPPPATQPEASTG
jgi:phosphatidylglycerol---prolipoprotein diacylglyceryl transferase